jgi:hypothetical protein
MGRIAAKLRQDMQDAKKDSGRSLLQPPKNILRIMPRRSRDPAYPVSFVVVEFSKFFQIFVTYEKLLRSTPRKNFSRVRCARWLKNPMGLL